MQERSVGLTIFQISSILIIGLYHISLFIHRRKDWTSVLFGSFCLIIALRALTTGNAYIYELFPEISWQLLNRIEYITFYVALPVFAMYLRSIFPGEFRLWVLRTIQVTGGLFILFVLLVLASIYTYSVQPYQAFTVLAGLYVSFVLVMGIIKKRDGAGILLAGFVIMFATVINDVLYSNEILFTGFYLPLGLLVFIFSKVGVSDAILLKPGKLNPEEFKSIQRHPIIGGDAIMNVESKINIQSFLTLGREIAYCHHEKWDGTGYPRGLRGEGIPLSARIVALADVYAALTSERPYKEAFSHAKARGIIAESRGSHFDPLIVDRFMAVEAEFNHIRLNFQDAE